MNEENYNILKDELNTIFEARNQEDDSVRIILGESPYPDGENLTQNDIGNGYPFGSVAFFRAIPPIKSGTYTTVDRIWSLIFGEEKGQVKDALDLLDVGEEYLVRYLMEEQSLYLINGYTDTKCAIPNRDVTMTLQTMTIGKILVLGNENLKLRRYFGKYENYFMVHPSAFGGASIQWKEFKFLGDGRYHSSLEIINNFRLK